MKGLLTLDIDGTLTEPNHQISKNVVSFLRDLTNRGYHLALITGRTFSFARQVLGEFDFPYYLVLQNGADILSMPEQKHLCHRYLSSPVLKTLDALFTPFEEDYFLYLGYRLGDYCAYRPHKYSEAGLQYLNRVEKMSHIKWKAVEDFTSLEEGSFAVAKCFGRKEHMEQIHAMLSREELFSCVIKDVIDPLHYLCLISSVDANKGTAAKWIQHHLNFTGPIIAAGDDNNDLPLLDVADIKIAVDTAPTALQNIADIISSPRGETGIIKALKEAVSHVEDRY